MPNGQQPPKRRLKSQPGSPVEPQNVPTKDTGDTPKNTRAVVGASVIGILVLLAVIYYFCG